MWGLTRRAVPWLLEGLDHLRGIRIGRERVEL